MANSGEDFILINMQETDETQVQNVSQTRRNAGRNSTYLFLIRRPPALQSKVIIVIP